MTHPLCLLRGIWRSLKTLLGAGYPCSGHDLVETEVIRNATVTISRCETCGEQDCAWERGEEGKRG